MTALYIIGGIVLFFVIIFHIPITAAISYVGKEFSLTVKYMFFTIYPRPEKPEADETADKPEESTALSEVTAEELSEETSEEETTEETAPDEEPVKKKLTREEKRALREEKKRQKTIEKRRKKREKMMKKRKREEIMNLVGMVIDTLKKSGKVFRRLVRGIAIHDISLDIDVANEDAYEAALGYGKMNMIVYNIVSFLRSFFTVSIDHININCKYNSSDSRYDGACVVRVTPATLLAVVLGLAVRFLFVYLRKKREIRKELKKAEKESARAVNKSALTA